MRFKIRKWCGCLGASQNLSLPALKKKLTAPSAEIIQRMNDGTEKVFSYPGEPTFSRFKQQTLVIVMMNFKLADDGVYRCHFNITIFYCPLPNTMHGLGLKYGQFGHFFTIKSISRFWKTFYVRYAKKYSIAMRVFAKEINELIKLRRPTPDI